ncbi:MAG: hypothetical protein SFV18_20130 [Bryobacteraceae bacterium]|nr:hypothetical protein [Bryobacteraceae bacterium]
MLDLVLACVLLAQSPAPARDPEPKAETAPEAPAAPDNARTQLNLLGQTDTKSGESRRNENVQFNLIDNNALKELNTRLGVTATFVTEFELDRSYFGTEYGTPPKSKLFAPFAARPAWHGQLNYGHLNSVFSARSFFQVGSVLPARENDYGVNLGGPAWRGGGLNLEASQRLIRGMVNGNVLIPLPSERTPLATDPDKRAYVQRILNAYPNVPPNRPDIDPRMLNTNSPQSIDANRFAPRIDQRLGSRDQLTARYAWVSQKVTAFQLIQGQNPDTTTRSHSSSLNWTRTWNPTTILNAAAGFERTRILIVPEKNNIGPQLFVSTALTQINPQNAVPIDRVQNDYRGSAQLLLVRGRHYVSMGGDLLHRRLNGFEGDSQLGAFSFNANYGNDPITNLRLGLPTTLFISVATIDLRRSFRNWEGGGFVQDRWTVSSNFTVNYGVSYRVASRPVEIFGRDVLPYRVDKNNFGPTLGFAYRRAKHLWRAAYALAYGEVFPVTYQQTRFNFPNNIKIVRQDPDLINPLPEGPGQVSRVVKYDFSPDLATPYSHQYNFVWQIEPRAGWIWQTGYIGSRALKLFQRWPLNRARTIPGVPLTTATVDQRRPDARYSDIRFIANGSRAYYDALRTSFAISRWRGLGFEAAYWWSKSMDVGSSYTNTAYDSDAFQNTNQSDQLSHRDLRALSDFDQPHSFLARGSWALPFKPNRYWGAWTLAAVGLAKTGTPFGVRTGSDAPGFGNVDGISGDRPNILDPTILGRTIGHPDVARQLLPRSAFSFVVPGELRGNIGRNTFRRGGIANLNASLSGNWTLVRELRMLLRVESIGLTNTPQFATPGNSLTDPNFGVITNTLNDGRTFRALLQLTF